MRHDRRLLPNLCIEVHMPLRAVNPDDPVESGPCDVIDICPICEGAMETVSSSVHQKVCVCVDCHSSIAVPAAAWKVRKTKRS
jgi:hypothetical protein